MEKIQIIREDCACANTFGEVVKMRVKSALLPILNSIEFVVPPNQNHDVRLWGLDDQQTSIYNILKDSDNLTGFKIGGDYFHLTALSRYHCKEALQGMEVSVKGVRYIKSDKD